MSHVTLGENNAHDNLRPLETIMPLLDNLLDVEVPFDKVAEQAFICLDKIGNTRRSRYFVEVEVEDGFAELPLSCEQVEAVFVAGPAAGGSLTGPGGGRAADELSRPALLPSGEAGIDLGQYGERYVAYTFRDGGLYVGPHLNLRALTRQAAGPAHALAVPALETPPRLRVLYRGIVSDERGYPLITPSEALACAYFVNYILVYKRFAAKQATGDQYQVAERLYNQHVNQARVSPLASANAMDRLLDEGKRLHRHHFGDDFSVR